MCPPLIVDADEMATGIRLFGEAVADVAEQPAAIAHEAADANALHAGEVAG
jgi:hypothetical protein